MDKSSPPPIGSFPSEPKHSLITLSSSPPPIGSFPSEPKPNPKPINGKVKPQYPSSPPARKHRVSISSILPYDSKTQVRSSTPPSPSSPLQSRRRRLSRRLSFEPLKRLTSLYQLTQSERNSDAYNFKDRYGNKYNFATYTLFFLSETNPIRMMAFKLLTHKQFERVILSAIIVNSILLACTDHSVLRFDVSLSNDLYGKVDTRFNSSMINFIVETLDPMFTVLFILEFIVKVITSGLVRHKNAYLRDWWNRLDFVIVLTSLLDLLSQLNLDTGIPNISAIRTFRVLRPLKSLGAAPGLRLIVKSLLASLPALSSVIVLIMFVFAIFGILSSQLFAGLSFQRCRLTPYPVILAYRHDLHSANMIEYKCIPDNINGDYDNHMRLPDNTGLDKETSPWMTPKSCYWPTNPADRRVCSVGDIGAHVCINGSNKGATALIDDTLYTWCGSNYDVFGNVRFKGEIEVSLPSGVPFVKDFDESSLDSNDELVVFMDQETFTQQPSYNDVLNYGLTTFDSFPYAFISIFQSITMEGWTDILYMCEDGAGYVVASTFFAVLIVFASFFVLNLLLAVLEENYATLKDEKDARDKADKEDAKLAADIEELGVSSAEEGKLKACVLAAKAKADKVVSVERFRKMTKSKYFQNTVTFLIVLNTLVLATESYPQQPTVSNTMEIFNFLLTVSFSLELIVKLLGYGWKGYVAERMNVFDALIVVFSIAEIIFSPPAFMTSPRQPSLDLGAISALRSFRFFRIFKLARQWTSMRILLNKIYITITEISNFSVLLFLFMSIYSLIGMEFFANRFKFDNFGYSISIGDNDPLSGESWEKIPSSRANFDDFHFSFITVFIMMTGENWNAIYYDAVRATNTSAVIYFFSLIMGGMFIVITLFLAVLLNNFGSSDDADDNDDDDDDDGTITDMNSSKVQPLDNTKKLGGGTLTTLDLNTSNIDNPQKHRKSKKRAPKKVKESIFPLIGAPLYFLHTTHPIRLMAARICSNPNFEKGVLTLIVISSLLLAIDNPLNNPNSELSKFLGGVDVAFTILFVVEALLKVICSGFVLQKRAYLRDGWNVLDFVVVSISVLSLFSYGDSSLNGLKSLRTFRAFRPLRMINRAPGVRLLVNAMFASIPDILNVTAVCSLFFLIFSIVGVTFFKGQFRLCQGEHFDSVILNSEVYDNYLFEPFLWSSTNTDLTSLFSASSNFFAEPPSCPNFPAEPCCVPGFRDNLSDDYIASYSLVNPSLWFETTPSSRDVCECLGATWDLIGCDEGQCFNQLFDNVGFAFLSFFEMSTTEGWVDVMNAAQDSRGINKQPLRDSSKYISLFFVLFMLVGSIFIMNLFVGVIVNNFNVLRRKAEGRSYLTEEQQAWVKTQQIVVRMKPKKKINKPGSALGDACHDTVMHKYFDFFIMAAILTNSLVMMLSTYFDSTTKSDILETINIFFAILFLVEMVMKMAAMRWLYFNESWNRFDCIISLGTAVGIMLQFGNFGNGSMTSKVATVVRVFRIGRVFRLVNGAESLTQLFNTLILTLPGLMNISALLALIYFIAALTAVQLYATVGFVGAYDVHANFRSFVKAFMLLLRFSTGENWNGVMHDIARGPEVCDPDPQYDPQVCGYADADAPQCNSAFEGLAGVQVDVNGCGNRSIFVFLSVFQLMVCFIFLNLFIGIILEGFETADETKRSVKPEDFNKFSKHWSEYDPTATYYMDMGQLGRFLQTLYAPWGFGLEYRATENEIKAFILELDLKVTEDRRVHFKDVLMGLSKMVVTSGFVMMKLRERAAREKSILAPVLAFIKRPIMSKLPRVRAVFGEDFRVGHHFAAEVVSNFMFKYVKGCKGRLEAEVFLNNTWNIPRLTVLEKAAEAEAEEAQVRAREQGWSTLRVGEYFRRAAKALGLVVYANVDLNANEGGGSSGVGGDNDDKKEEKEEEVEDVGNASSNGKAKADFETGAKAQIEVSTDFFDSPEPNHVASQLVIKVIDLEDSANL